MMEKKYRHEFKYLCSLSDATVIEHRLRTMMNLDSNVGEARDYHIRSVYFDDVKHSCLQKNEAGVDSRAKFRIRIYNHTDQRIMLEKKIKERTKTRKISTKLTREQCDILISGGCLPMTEEAMAEYSELLKQFLVLIQTRKFHPVTIVSYDRTPYVYKNGNVRITIDRNIAGSSSFSQFFEENLCKRPILPLGKVLIEVKYDEFFPEILKKQMDFGRLRQETFSKYYLCSKLIYNCGIIVK